MATVIQLESISDFNKCRDEVKDNSYLSWKPYEWSWFKEKTCYYPDEDCFISLGRAEELGFEVKPFSIENLKL